MNRTTVVVVSLVVALALSWAWMNRYEYRQSGSRHTVRVDRWTGEAVMGTYGDDGRWAAPLDNYDTPPSASFRLRLWLTAFWPTVAMVVLAIVGSRGWKSRTRLTKAALFVGMAVLLIIQGTL